MNEKNNLSLNEEKTNEKGKKLRDTIVQYRSSGCGGYNIFII